MTAWRRGTGRFRLGWAAAAAVLGWGALVGSGGPGAAQAPEAPVEPVRVSEDEARRMVRLMDDIYHAGVIMAHQMYVQDPGTPAAVTWGKQVMARVEARGWPAARIFDASGRPLNPENRVRDAFERRALEAFARGEASLEAREGDTLRYATPIRIADRRCIMCHVRNKEGDLVGGVSYRVPLR